MRKIYCIGEALVDIIFRGGQPHSAKAGGAMLNSAVSLGRAGLPVSLISEYGADDPGVMVNNFLEENGVGTSFINRFKKGQTALALAFLDDKNDAHYTFYKNYPEKRLDMKMPDLGSEDILLFGSIYSVSPEIRAPFFQLVSESARRGAILIYDPNFRASHRDKLEMMRPMIIENLKSASIVRASDEDLKNIFGTTTADESWEKIRNYCNCLIYTASTRGINVRTPSFSENYPVNKITPLSTIGAGDNFNAGLIASFCNLKIKAQDLINLGKREWAEIISTAASFAENVCMSYDNYIDLAFASRYRSASMLQM